MQIGRWHCVDLLAESYYSQSSYLFSGNNPIRFIVLMVVLLQKQLIVIKLQVMMYAPIGAWLVVKYHGLIFIEN